MKFELFLMKIQIPIFSLRPAFRPQTSSRFASKTEKFSLHFFKFCARPIFSKSLPRHQLCRILLFQKIKAEGGLAFNAFGFHFLFQSWCLGEKKIFCFGVPRIRNGGKRSNYFVFSLSLYTFGRHRPTQPNAGDCKKFPFCCIIENNKKM